jgi:dolichol-phosphate mannosyltransferase
VRALVIVPTYNERDNLPALLAAVLGLDPGIDVLVVDDNSPDGTGSVVDAISLGEPRLTVLHRPAKLGLGRAYVAGFAHALRHDYELVVEMDADFSHRPEDLPALLGAMEDADIAIGSRNVPGGGTVGWSRLRTLVSRGGSAYARALLGLPIKDCTSGFKCFRRTALARLDLDHLLSNGYAFQVEVNHACNAAGLRFAEVAITFPDRTRGRSKMTPGIALEAAFLVLKLRLGLTRPAVARQPLAPEV